MGARFFEGAAWPILFLALIEDRARRTSGQGAADRGQYRQAAAEEGVTFPAC